MWLGKSTPLLFVLLIGSAHAECSQVPARCARYADTFAAVAAHHGIPAELLIALATVESQCNPLAQSPVGAAGILQLMPETFRRVSAFTGTTDVWDPTQNIVAGGHYFGALIHTFGWWGHAIAAYNTGPGRVPHAVPDATWAYVERVISIYECQGGAAPKKETP